MITVDPLWCGVAYITGTHIRIDWITGMAWAGGPVSTVTHEYGLTRKHVIAACWYMARHGSRGWRRRWRGWLTESSSALYRGDYHEVADPPSREDTR